ncbi:hypothetical protein BGW80DRAFT_590541 [Lactifluus volemus]|nr:hypothetical protein BGW80DRAFT_590541 [Lactifluus volemus]
MPANHGWDFRLVLVLSLVTSRGCVGGGGDGVRVTAGVRALGSSLLITVGLGLSWRRHHLLRSGSVYCPGPGTRWRQRGSTLGVIDFGMPVRVQRPRCLFGTPQFPSNE